MTKRLFVNGLPYHVTGEILANFFLAYGALSVRLRQSKIWMALKWKVGP